DSPLLPPFIKDMIGNITYFMEAKSSMEVIIAAPTCGSSAVLPGTLISAVRNLGYGREALVQSLLAAAAVGVIIAEHSTFSAEIAGCQAECGAASAMAAAGLVQLLGRNAAEALAAASMALQNIMGSVCDPVAGRVEVPCLGKNVQAGMNALASASMSAAGFDAVIPFDEAVKAFDEAGRKIAPELRNTCRGGLSVTPTSLAIERQLQEYGHR
ncbi:MAG: L-serine ammonia-lyase, iron-sulfur-dependent, subunit alpha, partial [Lentisphaeria bacterium]|nr:L-serine ammonia-lyase, iron-sulfur-dependent, subunit alpha [Lentisphaeria bacterium]